VTATIKLLDGYKEYATKSFREKLTPIQQGLVLLQGDCLIFPNARKQKYYRYFLAKVRFAASCVRFDTTFAVAQLMTITLGSAGSFDGISLGTPSFKT
jgi:hypothetical protein